MTAKQKYLHPGDTLRKYGIIGHAHDPGARPRAGLPPDRVFDVGEHETLGDAAQRIAEAPAPKPPKPKPAPHAAGRLTPKQLAIQDEQRERNTAPAHRKLNRVGSTANPSYGVVLPKALIAPWTDFGRYAMPDMVKVEAVELEGGGGGAVGILITPVGRGAAIDDATQARELGDWDPREFNGEGGDDPPAA